MGDFGNILESVLSLNPDAARAFDVYHRYSDSSAMGDIANGAPYDASNFHDPLRGALGAAAFQQYQQGQQAQQAAPQLAELQRMQASGQPLDLKYGGLNKYEPGVSDQYASPKSLEDFVQSSHGITSDEPMGMFTPQQMANPVLRKGISDFQVKQSGDQRNIDLTTGVLNAPTPENIAKLIQTNPEHFASNMKQAQGLLPDTETPDLASALAEMAKVSATAKNPQEMMGGISEVFKTHPNLNTDKLAPFVKEFLTAAEQAAKPAPSKTREQMYELAMFGTPEEQAKYSKVIKRMQTDDVEQKRAGRAVTNIGSPSMTAGNMGPVNEQGVNPAALQGIDAGTQSLVKKMANYEIPLPSSRTKENLALLKRVAAYDPSFDAQLYPLRQKLRNSFTSGPDAKNITSLNTAIHHLDNLNTAIDALGNSPVPIWNKVANMASSASGSPKLTRVINAKNAVEGELASVFKGTGATDQEVKAWDKGFSTSGSPAQLKEGGVKEAVKLLEGRLDALIDKYQTGMGTTKDLQILSPKSLSTLKKLGVDVERYKAFAKGEGSQQQQSGRPAQPVFAKNPKTGHRLQSNDGGKTWSEAK